MKLSDLPRTVKKSTRRLGRGPGSGRGKTAGRGTKGLKARGKLPIGHSHFEGGQRALFKRLPYKRGKGNPKVSKKPLIVNLKVFNLLPKNVSTIDLETLVKFGIVDKDDAGTFGVKILGDGELLRPMTINLPISKSAAVKIEKAGGKVMGSQSVKSKS